MSFPFPGPQGPASVVIFGMAMFVTLSVYPVTLCPDSDSFGRAKKGSSSPPSAPLMADLS